MSSVSLINGHIDDDTPVEVVFCKDCKHTIINEKHKDKPLICVRTKMCGTTNPLFYCAAGERRDKK